jgi:hypothetical protein
VDKQKVFDQVAKHLLEQSAPSVDKDGNCLYRNAGGLKCAIGCLIPDAKFVASMEGPLSSYNTKLIKALQEELGDISADDFNFLRKLQTIHDGHNHKSPTNLWPSLLTELGKTHKLKTSAIKKFQKENKRG